MGDAPDALVARCFAVPRALAAAVNLREAGGPARNAVHVALHPAAAASDATTARSALVALIERCPAFGAALAGDDGPSVAIVAAAVHGASAPTAVPPRRLHRRLLNASRLAGGGDGSADHLRSALQRPHVDLDVATGEFLVTATAALAVDVAPLLDATAGYAVLLNVAGRGVCGQTWNSYLIPCNNVPLVTPDAHAYIEGVWRLVCAVDAASNGLAARSSVDVAAWALYALCDVTLWPDEEVNAFVDAVGGHCAHACPTAPAHAARWLMASAALRASAANAADLSMRLRTLSRPQRLRLAVLCVATRMGARLLSESERLREALLEALPNGLTVPLDVFSASPSGLLEFVSFGMSSAMVHRLPPPPFAERLAETMCSVLQSTDDVRVVEAALRVTLIDSSTVPFETADWLATTLTDMEKALCRLVGPLFEPSADAEDAAETASRFRHNCLETVQHLRPRVAMAARSPDGLSFARALAAPSTPDQSVALAIAFELQLRAAAAAGARAGSALDARTAEVLVGAPLVCTRHSASRSVRPGVVVHGW